MLLLLRNKDLLESTGRRCKRSWAVGQPESHTLTLPVLAGSNKYFADGGLIVVGIGSEVEK